MMLLLNTEPLRPLELAERNRWKLDLVSLALAGPSIAHETLIKFSKLSADASRVFVT
jgi:hypothetical protein